MSSRFVQIGAALSAPARASMVECLFDGAEHSAGELARAAGVASPTASEHLRVLVDSGLVSVRTQGRRRLFRLADQRTASALEQLSGGDPVPQAGSLRLSREQRRVRAARTCYDHLAGQLGVAVAEHAVRRGWVDDRLATIREHGDAELRDQLGVDVDAVRAAKRTSVRPCLDWTERRPHLAGGLGAAIATSLLERRWVERRAGSRGLVVTPLGDRGLAGIGLDLETTVPD